jgi:Helix-turn-helix domain
MPNAKPAWTTRIWLEYRAGTLTRAARDVLLTLHTFRGTGGHCWPSHETLADRADCCTKTVQRALRQAQHLGLVSWGERRVRAGWRWLRTSNLYRLMAPETPVQPGMRIRPVFRPPSTTGQNVGGGESLRKKEREVALEAMRREALAAPDLLAMRRTVIERRLAIGAATAKAW